jgi:hypothetical protein
MTRDYSAKVGGRPPTCPGELLREDVLPALGISVAEAARKMRVNSSDALSYTFRPDGGYPGDGAAARKVLR